MSLVDQGYRHWEGQATGVWQRRKVIVQTGLRLCLSSKILRFLIALSWSAAIGATGVYFLFGQLMAPESALLSYFGRVGGQQVEAAIKGIAAWFLLYPDICVDGLYRVTLFAVTGVCHLMAYLSIILFVPKLIAQDLSTNAIIIYSSKALTRFDYMLGKFGIVFSILTLIWIMPISLAWIMGNLMAPYWDFFAHSLPAFLIAFSIAVVGCASISLLALAVSALAKRTSSAIAFWCIGWIALGIISAITGAIHPWGSVLSPGGALDQIAWHAFDLMQVFEKAREMLPFFNFALELDAKEQVIKEGLIFQTPLALPIIAILGYAALSILIISKRVKPE